jgi:hypothetical protein
MSGLELLIQLVKSVIRLFIGTASYTRRYASAEISIGSICPIAPGERVVDDIAVKPSLAQIAGHMLNAIFIDTLDMDLERLQRVN